MNKSSAPWPWRGLFTACLAMGGLGMIGARADAQVSGARHVVVIGIDGLSPDGIRKAATPQLHQLMKTGASTLHARAVMPTVSSPNWASMIMGAGPEQHGVTTNDWEPDKFNISPTAVGAGGKFPTIFSLLRSQRPTAKIACYHDWEGFSPCSIKKPPTSSSIPRGLFKPVSARLRTSRRNGLSLRLFILITSMEPAMTTVMAHHSITRLSRRRIA